MQKLITASILFLTACGPVPEAPPAEPSHDVECTTYEELDAGIPEPEVQPDPEPVCDPESTEPCGPDADGFTEMGMQIRNNHWGHTFTLEYAVDQSGQQFLIQSGSMEGTPFDTQHIPSGVSDRIPVFSIPEGVTVFYQLTVNLPTGPLVFGGDLDGPVEDRASFTVPRDQRENWASFVFDAATEDEDGFQLEVFVY